MSISYEDIEEKQHKKKYQELINQRADLEALEGLAHSIAQIKRVMNKYEKEELKRSNNIRDTRSKLFLAFDDLCRFGDLLVSKKQKVRKGDKCLR